MQIINRFLCKLQILYYDRIDVSEGIDINKRGASKDRHICHYGYFLDKGFTFQPIYCKGCNDVLMMSMNLNNISILNINGIDYHCIITEISKCLP